MKLAFFGSGLMGTAFVHRLRATGHEVNVWSRCAAKAQALESIGARAFNDPCAALAGTERIHLSLSDDVAVDTVLEPIASAVPEGVWIVDHSTTAVTPTAERVSRWNARGRTFVHAPVFMSPSEAREGTGIMLASGEKAHYDTLVPALQQMARHILYVGTAPDRAAAFKLLGNLAMIGIVGLLGDVNRLAHAAGISTEDAFSFLRCFNPGQLFHDPMARIESSVVAPTSFAVSMARKDLRLMTDEARSRGVDLFVAPGVAAMLDAAISCGEAARDVTAAARVSVDQP